MKKKKIQAISIKNVCQQTLDNNILKKWERKRYEWIKFDIKVVFKKT